MSSRRMIEHGTKHSDNQQPSSELRRCKRCRRSKLLDKFSLAESVKDCRDGVPKDQRRRYRRHVCIECFHKHSNTYYARNKKRILKRTAAYRRAIPRVIGRTQKGEQGASEKWSSKPMAGHDAHVAVKRTSPCSPSTTSMVGAFGTGRRSPKKRMERQGQWSGVLSLSR